MRRSFGYVGGVLLVGVLGLAGCGEDATTSEGGPIDTVEGSLQPSFELGQTWVVGTVYRQATMRLPEDAAVLSRDPDDAGSGFSPSIPEAVRPAENELWSTVIYWQFGVINTDFVPDSDSTFYALALDPAGVAQPITILKAIAPKEFNGEALSEQLDPVFYLILRESDYRVRGVHYNYRVPGGRNTVVLELPENASGNPELGADLNYFLVDYFMPAFPLDDAADYTLALGSGDRQMVVTRLGDGAVETRFASAMDNREVRQRWDEGNPWFTWSATPARVSWLAGPTELAALMEANGVDFLTTEAFQESTQTIAQKFRNRIDLRAELRVEPGSYTRSVSESYQPWAGDYWPTRRSALSLGFSGRGRSIAASSPTRQAVTVWTNTEGETAETRLRAMDQELEALRELDRKAEDFDNVAYSERVRAYYAERRAVVADLRAWFENPQTGFIARLRAGDVDLSDVNNWSPLDKYGLYLLSQGAPGPFEAAIWEAGTQFHPGGPGWWGKCNGWSAAAILFDEPREDLTLTLPLSALNGRAGSLSLTMQTADLKGLATASNYGGYSIFYGERYNGPEQQLADLYPAVFHRILSYYIGTEHFPLVMDTTASEEVWNFPLYRYETTLTEGSRNDAQNCQNMSVRTRVRFASDGVSEDHVDGAGNEPEGFWNDYTYDLCVRDGVVVGDGTWTGSSVDNHPDFAWVIYQNDQRPQASHRRLTATARDNLYFGSYAPNENPFLYTDVLDTVLSPRVNAPGVCNPEPNDCPDEQLCAAETGECRPRGVGEDPNPTCDGGETRQVAVALSAGSLAGQRVCAGVDSWYAVSLAAADQLEVTVTFRHADGDIDIALFDPSDQSVATSTSTGDREVVAHRASRAGTYLLRVYGYNNAANAVTLDVTVTPASSGGGGDTCAGADDEPNADTQTATVLDGEVIERAAAICETGDEDFYRIGLTGAYKVLVEFEHAAGDLDIQLLSVADGAVLGRSAGTTDEEQVEGTGPAILRVYGWSGAVGEYRVSVVGE